MVVDSASLDPTGAAHVLPPSTNRKKPARRLHEPFVSPEFRACEDRGFSQLGGGVDGNNRRRSTAIFPGTGDAQNQAAPLYTVNAALGDRNDVLVAPSAALTDSLLLGKRLSVADAERLSAAGPASETSRPVAGWKGVPLHPATNNGPLPCASGGQADVESTVKSPLNSPQDMSPWVTNAVCTWGQELVSILGLKILAPSEPAPHTAMISRPALTTTGLFPQTMTLRFSSSVRVASVHLQASSLLRLVVKPGEGFLGGDQPDGRTVTVPAIAQFEESRGGGAVQNVDVAVGDLPSFSSTRSVDVTIAAGSEAFCSIYRIYVLGFRV